MRSLFSAAVLTAFALPAQSPPVFSMNDTTTTVTGAITSTGFSGFNGRAWQITPAATVAVVSGRLFTENVLLAGSKFMSLEIWTDGGGQPGNRIAGGTWKIVNARTLQWQGTSFDNVVPLLASTPYWVVWKEQGSSRIPVEPGGVTTPTMRANGAGWAALPAEAPKIRLYAGLLDDAYATPYGFPCATTGGLLPTVFTNEQPNLGNAGFFFETNGSPPSQPVFLVLGTNPAFASTPVPGMAPGCMQHTDIVTTLLAFAGTGTVTGPTAAGCAAYAVPIPAATAFTGMMVAAQAAPFDPGSTYVLPFAAANALRIVLY